MTEEIWNVSNMYETSNIRANIPLYFLIRNICLQSTFICNHNKPLSNKVGETFCEGLLNQYVNFSR